MNIYRRYQQTDTPKQSAPKPSATIAKPKTDSAPVDFKIKRGRPRIEDKGKTLSDLKPWLSLGMCRRTWEKRQKEERLKNV
jgi:hypothetical protein